MEKERKLKGVSEVGLLLKRRREEEVRGLAEMRVGSCGCLRKQWRRGRSERTWRGKRQTFFCG